MLPACDRTSDVLARNAIRKAHRLFPGVIGEVLVTEIKTVWDFSWLGPHSRTVELIEAILALPDSGPLI